MDHEVSRISLLLILVLSILGCSQNLIKAFGEIFYSPNSYYYLRCYLNIMRGGIPDAVAVLSVQEINLEYCRYTESIFSGIADAFSNMNLLILKTSLG